jgi:hypothetical protein
VRRNDVHAARDRFSALLRLGGSTWIELAFAMATLHDLFVAQFFLFDQGLSVIVRAPVLHAEIFCQFVYAFSWQ